MSSVNLINLKKTLKPKTLFAFPIFILFLFGTNVVYSQRPSVNGLIEIIKGREKYIVENYNVAISHFQRAFQDQTITYKDSTEIYFFLAFCYAKLKNEELGAQYFEKILDRNPDEKLPEGFDEFADIFETVKNQLLCSLDIKSIPTLASIYINNEYIGETPKTLHNLTKRKSYKIEFRKSSYYSKTISFYLNKDTSLIIELELYKPETITFSRPPQQSNIRSYLIGLSSGALLGLASGFASMHFDNQAREKIRAYSIEKDTMKINKLETTISRNQFWSNFFYYSSYFLTAVGFYAGYKISEPFFQQYSFFGKDSSTKIYCSLNQKLEPSINIRRKIW